jgi:hypothetical protein
MMDKVILNKETYKTRKHIEKKCEITNNIVKWNPKCGGNCDGKTQRTNSDKENL